MRTLKRNSQSGFTLLEILVATGIFALSVLAFVQSRSISLRNVVESERLARALQLGQLKMAEVEMKYQKVLDRDGLEAALVKENGGFDAPNDAYTWKAELKAAGIDLSAEQFVKVLVELGIDKDEAEKQVDDPQQALLMTNLNKAIKENYGELSVVIEWDQLGRKARLPLITHLIPEKPKIQLQMTAEK